MTIIAPEYVAGSPYPPTILGRVVKFILQNQVISAIRPDARFEIGGRKLKPANCIVIP